MKRTIKRRKNSNKKRFILLLVTLIVLAGILFGISYLNTKFYFFTTSYISPIPEAITGKGAALAFIDPKQEMKKKVEEVGVKVVNINTSNAKYYELDLEDGEQIIFSTSKDLKLQVASLQLVLNRLTIEGKKFKRLDFRFDKPVITF